MTEAWTNEVNVPGPIVWRGYTVPCDRCGSTEPWTLVVQQRAWIIGVDAYLVCPDGHHVFNPLVTPWLGYHLDGVPDVMAELASLDQPGTRWVPHGRSFVTPDDLYGAQFSDMPSGWINFDRCSAIAFKDTLPDLHAAMIRE